MTSTKEIETTMRNYYQQRYAKRSSNLEEMDAFLETYKLQRNIQSEQINIKQRN